MSVRKIKKSYISCVGYFKSYKNNRQLAFESILERDFFMLLEFDKDVVSFEDQPLKIKYMLKAKNTRYTPDVLVTYKDDSKRIFEVKYQSDIDSDPKLQHKISVLKEEIARQMFIPFETFTDAQIDQIYFKNCVFLYKNAFLSENYAVSTKIQENINQLSEPISIKSFLELLSTNQTEQLQILPYLWHRIFKEPSLINMHTKIILKNLTRKSKISIAHTSDSILTRLNIFDKNFKCILQNEKNKNDFKELTKEARVTLIEEGRQFFWNLPESFDDLGVDTHTKTFFTEKGITGKIITTKDTIKEAFKGITLYARGKLANNPEFYDVKLSNSHAYSYMSGEIHIDYMDEDTEDDYISTARNSLIWENEEARTLKVHLQEVIKKIGKDWRNKRIDARDKELREDHGINTIWYETAMQSGHDRKLAKKITDIVLASNMEANKTKELLNYVEGAFEFQVFKDYASDIEDNIDGDKLLKLLQDWEVIEHKEHYRLALGRIETINKFKSLIKADTKEVGGLDSMHKFLNSFPWILEPRISSFDDEITYKKLLLDNFPDANALDVKDRRIDFLCKNFGDTLYILEIKRSKKIIGKDELLQLQEYYEFVKANIQENSSDRAKYSHVKAYIIGKNLKDDQYVRTKMNTLEKSDMHFLSYDTMLDQAEQYHKDFIDAYEKTNNLTKKASLDN